MCHWTTACVVLGIAGTCEARTREIALINVAPTACIGGTDWATERVAVCRETATCLEGLRLEGTA